jgi:membrane protein DedA with SNARE-associated domain
MELETVQELVRDYGPLAVGVGSTLDNTGVPIFFIAGLAAGAVLDVRPEAMFVASLLGSIAGDIGVYVIGRYFLTKERILEGRIGQGFRPILEAGEKVMHRWGFWSIIFGRFVPYLGKVLPFVAGAYGMRWLQAGASICLGSVLLMGFFFVYSDLAFDLVREQGSAVKAVSLAIGTGCLAAMWWANRVLSCRERQAGEAEVRKSRYR